MYWQLQLRGLTLPFPFKYGQYASPLTQPQLGLGANFLVIYKQRLCQNILKIFICDDNTQLCKFVVCKSPVMTDVFQKNSIMSQGNWLKL